MVESANLASCGGKDGMDVALFEDARETALSALVENEAQVLPVVTHAQGEFAGILEQRDIHAVLASARRKVGRFHHANVPA